MGFERLLSQVQIGKVTIRNRIVSTAHGTYMSEAGLPTPRIAAYQEARAKGGVGLIIHEAANVHETGVGASRYANAHTDACIPGYRLITEAAHRHGATIFGQLYHPGRSDIAGSSDDGSVAVSWAPSAVPSERLQLMPREVPTSLIHDLVGAYAAAAGRMRRAGFDGIEVMAHHGHLVAQFLNPRVNHRTDEYGGSDEERLRFLREVLTAVRDVVGPDLPVGLRVSGEEYGPDAMDLAFTTEICRVVDALGIVDYYFHVVAGSSANFASALHIVPPMAFGHGYTAPFAGRIRESVRVPVIVTGRVVRPETAEAILAAGQADLVGMTRAMICDPELAAKTATGRADEIRTCIGCNQACIGHSPKGAAISCIQYPESGREQTFGRIRPAAAPRRVLVAGGGPAGLKAAAVASARGHRVTLHEAAGSLGGQANLAAALPRRAEFGAIVTNLAREVRASGVEIRLGERVDAELVRREAPDVVVVATGSGPYRPEFPGSARPDVLDAWQVLIDGVEPGPRVVIADMRLDWVAMGLAERFAQSGRHVRIAVGGYMAGQNIHFAVRDHWAGVLEGLGVEVEPYRRLVSFHDRKVLLEHLSSQAPIEWADVDTLVLAAGGLQDTMLERELAADGFGGETHLIGDCVTPRTCEEAVLEGLKVGWAI